VVCGVTVDGEVLRQPGWAEQLCDRLHTTGAMDPQLYGAHVRPVTIEGVAAVVVRVSLQLVDEKAFEMIKQYVADHRLQVRAGRGSRDAEEAEPNLLAGRERRSPDNNW
jgi:hypothetical protein